MSLPGNIAIKALSVAKGFADANTTEQGGNNRGAQVERFLAAVDLPPGQPWCASFVWHCLHKAAGFLNRTLPVGFPKSGYCPDFQAYGRRTGNWISVGSARSGNSPVKPGDLALFYMAKEGRVAHIGFVIAVYDWGVVTIEGNTGPEAGEGVNRDGDGVYRKLRSWGELGALGGFVRLSW